MMLLDVLWDGLGKPWAKPGEKPWLAVRVLTALAFGLPALHVATVLRLPVPAAVVWTLATTLLGFLVLGAHGTQVYRRLLAAGGQAPLEAVDEVLATATWPWLLWPVLSGVLPGPGTWALALGLLALQVARATRDLALVSGVGADRCLSAWVRPLGDVVLLLMLLIAAGASLATATLAP